MDRALLPFEGTIVAEVIQATKGVVEWIAEFSGHHNLMCFLAMWGDVDLRKEMITDPTGLMFVHCEVSTPRYGRPRAPRASHT